eukprot:SAG11_NODE_4970_length_1707_cov_4.660448_2_plen_349_part_01
MCTQFLFGSARGIRSAAKSYSLGIMMLCHKDDEAGVEMQRAAGFPSAEVGKGKWKSSLYIKTNGETNPSLYVNIYGQTIEESRVEQQLLEHFDSISKVMEGKEESDIRKAHKKHRAKMYEHMQKKCQLQLTQTKLRIEKEELNRLKESYKDAATECTNRPSFAEQNLSVKSKELLTAIKTATSGDSEVTITLLSYMLAVAKQESEEAKIEKVESEYDSLTKEIHNTEDKEKEERDLVADVVKTMENRNKKRKDSSIAAADLPSWSEPAEKRPAAAVEEPESKKPKLDISNEGERVRQMILEKLEQKGKSVKDDAAKIFDKDKNGQISVQEFKLILFAGFKIEQSKSEAI